MPSSSVLTRAACLAEVTQSPSVSRVSGVKSEGELVISGTKGYIYVPAPWWRTDYFEIRYEDQNQNKKYFYPYVGEGLRYEIKDFVSSVISKQSGSSKLTKKEILCMVKAQEQYLNGINVIDL